MIISLTGFMGCGKSSVGRRLSELLCCRFMDLDEEIEKQGRSITEIFKADGEDGFRAIEATTLKDLLTSPEATRCAILSLGGGTVMRKECAEMVRERTLCIYLKASVDTLVKNLEGETDGRPMLASERPLRERIAELMSLRSSTYESTAHIIIDTDGKNIEEITAMIMTGIPYRQ